MSAGTECVTAEQRRVKRASEVLKRLFVAWHDLKTLPEFNGRLRRNNERHFALAGLIARQVSLVHAANAVVGAGRPGVAWMLVRSMYETWLTMLAIAHLRFESHTPESLAKRYLDHLTFQQGLEARKWRRHTMKIARERGANLVQVRTKIESMIDAGNGLKSVFSSKAAPWHPFGGSYSGLAQLRDALWPKGRQRRFPRHVFAGRRREWDEEHDLFWSSPSREVHAAGWSIQRFVRDDPTGAVNEGPEFEVAGLLVCIDLCGRSMQIIATVADLDAEWDATSFEANSLLKEV